MGNPLLLLKNVQRLCQQCFPANILCLSMPGNLLRILGYHFWAVDNIYNKLIHAVSSFPLFLMATFGLPGSS